jgi:serine/threonine protein kinase
MMQTSEASLLPGHVVAGKYRIESVLGEGGFGTVFRATQMNLGRTVALKVLLPHLVAHDDGMSRFKREAQLAQRLEHPNTVRLFDFGVEGETPFIAFELLKGDPLDKLLAREGRLPAARVARIGTQELKSLMEAHGLGVVHRDIKPSNIFLCDFPGEPDFVKVLDFGIAKATQASGHSSVGLTRVGEAVGTPSYMAPEQVSGASITPGADLYALGLVLAEALTGEVVMKGDSGIQIVMAQVSAAAVPLSPAVLQSPLGPVIHRATQKNAERRYASAAEMLAHIEQVMKGAQSVVVSAPPGQSAPGAPPPANAAYLQTNVAAYAGPFQQTPAAPQAHHPPHAPSGPPPGPAYGYPPQHGSHGPLPSPHYNPAAWGHGPALPPPAVRRSSDGTSCGVIALIAGAGLLVLGIIVVVIIAVSVSQVGGPTASGGDPGLEPSEPASGNGFAALTLEELKAKVEASGYSVTSESSSRSSNVETMQVGGSRGLKFVTVMLMKYDTENLAEMVETSMRSNEQAVVGRDGNAILMVIVPNDKAAARDVLDTIGR